jgi:tetratricopeptide (TPR) repeat protein
MRLVLLFLLFFVSKFGFTQTDLKSQLIGKSWYKTEIRLSDDSKIFKAEVNDIYHSIFFINKDSILVNSNGKSSFQKYFVKDSVLQYGLGKFKINLVSDVKLILTQMDLEPQVAFKITYIPKRLNDLLYKPQSYIAKNKALVYKQISKAIEPSFLDENYAAMDYIFMKFGFPEYKRGGFVIRFIITDKGKLTGIKIVASSNDKYNQKLIKAVLSTKDKWRPAEFLGEYINTEIEYNFNLGWETPKVENVFAKTKADSLAESEYYLNYGNDMFEGRSYSMALPNYTKAIELNPLNIEAYYQRAAAYVMAKKLDKACLDYKQLMFMEQKKAKILFEKYCNKP